MKVKPNEELTIDSWNQRNEEANRNVLINIASFYQGNRIGSADFIADLLSSYSQISISNVLLAAFPAHNLCIVS